MEEKRKCPRCLNEDPAWFYHGHKGWYCRKCISFGRIMLEEENETETAVSISENADEYTLKYPFTDAQKVVAAKCLKEIENKDVLIHAVTGAGKTEIVLPAISEYLRQGKRVCFAIARRQVVLEVAERLQGYFTNASVIAVCGGHTSVTEGDLIVCTTHQLYRYHDIDLLILDEPDAFPFKGNDVLKSIAHTACSGHTIYLTATPDEEMMERVRQGSLVELKLDKRPHGKPIPVPEIKIHSGIFMFIALCIWIRRHENHPRMIFVPSIAMAYQLGNALRLFFKVSVCTSHEENRDQIIEEFRKQGNGIIIATTVLERGVTIPHADICIYHAENRIFDKAGLIQMAGRAGRDFHDPYGDVLFLCNEKSLMCEECVKELEEANAS